jgi:hypothetical protein
MANSLGQVTSPPERAERLVCLAHEAKSSART